LHADADMDQWIDSREAEIAKIAGSAPETAELQQHVAEIVESKAFKGSPRAEKFLRYVINHALTGDFESLKERVIGVKLFGRPPHYETGEDAIVRVTASDVRKRLAQYYNSKYGTTSKFHINLPAGSYLPYITRQPPEKTAPLYTRETSSKTVATSLSSATNHLDSISESPGALAAPRPSLPTESGQINARNKHPWLYVSILLTLLNLALWGIVWMHFSRAKVATALSISVPPWSVFFNSQHAIQLIASDPNEAEIEWLTGQQVSVSDYANRKYIPQPNHLSPDMIRICQIVLRGDKASAIDAPIIANVAALAQANSAKIDVHVARSIALSNLNTDDNLIFLGSPRSNPWSSLFSDQLDFRYGFNPNPHEEFILNVHPRQTELEEYVGTAAGWNTGQSYAIIAFVRNPDHHGQILLVSGISAEGTEAAGALATDLSRLSAILQKCGISPSGPLKHFELLLRINTMAGSPTSSEVIACHILQDSPTQK
jgi:hypothetical protein